MSVVGFQEFYQHAVSVMVSADPDLIVTVVSLAGLAMLKLVSWDDNIDSMTACSISPAGTRLSGHRLTVRLASYSQM